MEIPDNIEKIIGKLYSNKLLGPNELSKIEWWLEQNYFNPETEAWLKTNWEGTANISTGVSFNDIRRRIRENNEKLKQQKWQWWMRRAQRVAAILLLPLFLATAWLAYQHFYDAPQWLALTTKQGERTHVVLPDGSEVWINVDSRLEYATSFNQKNRSLKLSGEAWFRVAKDKELPFTVNAKNIEVTAVGTEFNISAYPDEANVTAFLNEGIVKLGYSGENNSKKVIEMIPGEQAVFNQKNSSLQVQKTTSPRSGNWRNGELYFGNESMDAVFRKMERWYGITIHFNPKDFEGETLTVNLKNGEQVEQLLEIINNAIGITISKNENEYRIKKNKK